MSTRARLILAWIALFAILLGASAPTATRLLGKSRGEPVALVEVCSIHAATDAPHPSDHPTPDSVQGDSCPFCFSHAASHTPPSAPLQLVFESPARHGAPSVANVLPNVAKPWLRAQPRGPPEFI